MKEYEVTKAERFQLRDDKIVIEYSDLPSGWHWRLRVNDKVTSWAGLRADLLYLDCYVVVSPYFEGTGLISERPFYINYAMEDKS
jgi:hypothetical protein